MKNGDRAWTPTVAITSKAHRVRLRLGGDEEATRHADLEFLQGAVPNIWRWAGDKGVRAVFVEWEFVDGPTSYIDFFEALARTPGSRSALCRLVALATTKGQCRIWEEEREPLGSTAAFALAREDACYCEPCATFLASYDFRHDGRGEEIPNIAGIVDTHGRDAARALVALLDDEEIEEYLGT